MMCTLQKLVCCVVLTVIPAQVALAALHASVRQGDYQTRIGEPLRVVAEMVATADYKDCYVKLATDTRIGFGYQFTDGQDGPRIGAANAKIDLKRRQSQALWLIITPQVLLDEAEVAIEFLCADGVQAVKDLPRHTFKLTVNAPYLRDDMATIRQRMEAAGEDSHWKRGCPPWPVEHVYMHFANTLIVRLTAANFDDSQPVRFPTLGTVTVDYEVEEVLRGDASQITAIRGPIGIEAFSVYRRVATGVPVGARYIVSGDQGAVQWESCSLYSVVPTRGSDSCQLYRYRRLADDSEPYNATCEAANIASYLGRLNVVTDTSPGGNRLQKLSQIWRNATGHNWDGKEVPNSILYREPFKGRTVISAEPLVTPDAL